MGDLAHATSLSNNKYEYNDLFKKRSTPNEINSANLSIQDTKILEKALNNAKKKKWGKALSQANSIQNKIFKDRELLCIEINSPPIKGKANLAIIKLLSKTLNIPKSKIRLIKGHTSQKKTFYIHIPNLKIQEIYKKLSN